VSAYDREHGHFAYFTLTRIVNKAIDQFIPVKEQIESDVQWLRLVHLELFQTLALPTHRRLKLTS